MKKILFFSVIVLLVALSACGSKQKILSPTEVFISHYEAEIRRDLVTLEGNLSKDSLKAIKETSIKQNLDESYLIENSLGISKTGFPEVVSEKIEDRTAVIKIKNPLSGRLDEMPFVKEDGRWKIDLYKFINDSLKQLNKKD
ncbi:hypothetical protein BH10ACI1_BH10ACI1_15220 [soil metagenome]